MHTYLSLLTIIKVSTTALRFSIACKACCIRLLPSNPNGLVTTPTHSHTHTHSHGRNRVRIFDNKKLYKLFYDNDRRRIMIMIMMEEG